MTQSTKTPDVAGSCESYLAEQLAKRILVMDGAMGTMIQALELTEAERKIIRHGFETCGLTL